ncbi:glycosyltransferase family 39 protein [Hymenobacter humi]|uniref:Glycosyltransferase family 39 protein n=1 Tax=Hymenobacter humi TaxID=1411620 RepID=A0ABW2U5S8_9BACT
MKRILPWAFALLKFVSGYFLISPVYELQRDEYLYLVQGQHLAWGYLEVPPLIAAQAWAALALGGGEGWVKFWPFLWGAATVYVVVRLAGRLGGGWFAQALAGTCYLGSAFARLNILFQPNSFEVFGFVACLYALVGYIQEHRPRYLYAMGLCLGLGLLNKYTTLFFIAALGGALLLTPQRRLLLQRHFWGAAGLALLLWLPNVVWQLRHGIPFLHHMALLKQSQPGARGAGRFLKAQPADVFAGHLGVGARVAGPAAGARLQAVPGCGAGGGAGRGAAGRSARQGLLRPGLLPGAVCFWGGVVGAAVGPGRPATASGPGAFWVDQGAAAGHGAFPAGIPAVFPAADVPGAEPCHHGRAAPRYAHLGIYRWEDGQQHALPQDYADMLGWREPGRQNLGRLPKPARFGARPHPHLLRQLRPGQRHQLLQPAPRTSHSQ